MKRGPIPDYPGIIPPPPARKPCVWAADGMSVYKTSCGESLLSEFTMGEICAKYCLFCGRPLEVVEEDED